MDLTGRIGLVTDTTSGIGRATAIRSARSGRVPAARATSSAAETWRTLSPRRRPARRRRPVRRL